MKSQTFFDNTVEVFIIDKNDFITPDNPFLSEIISNLSIEEQNKYFRYRNVSAQYQYLTAHYYLRLLLSKRLSETPAEIQIVAQENGKPYLKGHTNLQFNISHTKNLVLIAFSEYQAMKKIVTKLAKFRTVTTTEPAE